ncbi:hypothetical protein H2203_008013 [Taxawa tesnikishii (nom. ined.)]|nr:hypothetical protein H2203_008013 [Dothideales sp. JES 119]
MHSLTTLSIFASLAAAQTTTFTYVIPGFDDQTVLGSVVASDSAATTLAVSCQTGPLNAASLTGSALAAATSAWEDSDDSDCGLYPGMTITAGPSTIAYSIADAEESATAVADCKITPSSGAVCSQSLGGSGADFQTNGITTVEASELGTLYVVATGAAGTGSGVASNTASATTAAGTAGGVAAGGASGSASASAASSAITSIESALAGSASGSASMTTTASGSATGSATQSSSATAASQTGNSGSVVRTGAAGFGLLAAMAGVLVL